MTASNRKATQSPSTSPNPASGSAKSGKQTGNQATTAKRKKRTVLGVLASTLPVVGAASTAAFAFWMDSALEFWLATALTCVLLAVLILNFILWQMDRK